MWFQALFNVMVNVRYYTSCLDVPIIINEAKMNFNKLLILLFFTLPFYSAAQSCEKLPPSANPPKLVSLGNYSIVEGDVNDFDFCHSSVRFAMPWGVTKPPLVILVHGGGGLSRGEIELGRIFLSMGFATLMFDAYKMNDIDKPPLFMSSSVSLFSKQQMLYKITLGAYKWAIKNEKVNLNKIFFYGLSNGATTVANIAAAVDPLHVKAVFAEGMVGAGLGMPDNLKVPLRLIYGKLDNFGMPNPSDSMWLRQERCRANRVFEQPQGTAASCNQEVNRELFDIRPIDWYQMQVEKNADIKIWWLEESAHGIFLGQLNKTTMVSGGRTVFTWTGGPTSDRDKLISQIKNYVASLN